MRRRHAVTRALYTILLSQLAFAMTGAALAADTSLPQLSWSAPVPGCPGRGEVLAAIERWLRPSLERVDAGAVRAVGDIHEQAGRYTLSLSLTTPSGRADERFAAPSCETLVEVVALKVALAANAVGLESLPVGASAQDMDVADEAAQLSLRAAGLISFGQLPGASPAVSLMLGWTSGRVRMELGASYAPQRAARYEQWPQAGVDIRLANAVVRACLVTHLGVVDVPTCAGVELGWMHATGVGTIEPAHADQTLGSVTFGPALRWGFAPPVSAWLELSAALAFWRPTGFYLGRGSRDAALPVVYRSDQAAARAILGLEVTF